MIVPSVSCTIARLVGADIYGKETMSAPVPSLCSVVKLSASSEKTSVRADSSASRGMAQEKTHSARLLFLSTEDISEDDRVTVAGLSLKVKTIEFRFDVRGVLDHLQVDLNSWA